MKNPFLSLLRTLHAWGGLTLCLLLMLISFTGTLLVWKDNYLRLTEPAARVAFTPTPEALAVIGAAVDRQFDPAQVLGIRFATEELPLTQVLLDEERYAYLDTQGAIIDEWQGNGRIEEWLFDLHHRLLLGNLGLSIAGIAGCAAFILVLAGVIVFWPMRRGWRHGLVPRSSERPALLASHRNLGIVLALPLLLSFITGAILAFPTQVEDWYLREVRLDEDYSNAMVEGLDSLEGAQNATWLTAMQRTAAVFPGATLRTAQVPNAFSAYRILGVQQQNEWNRSGMSQVYIDTDGGWMDLRIDALNAPLPVRLFNDVTPLHTARIGQLWYKVLLTLSGAGLFLLSALGLVSFVKRYTRQLA
ncbi:MAG: PepSY domain-containing protein [Pseudomonadales bacterium]|nr:PepSY domain-containing protein [Pseudomonadales bacterium]